MQLLTKTKKIGYISLGIILFTSNIAFAIIWKSYNSNDHFFLRLLPLILMSSCFGQAKRIYNLEKGRPAGYTSRKEIKILLISLAVILIVVFLFYLH